ncbi:MAG: nucleoside triphosphate pyrophosphohydrolase [Hyphomicrobiaceae bacterium]|nr:MAG: nucleoside triphosphate pyrophosphohydrolase [Hyphomicrobiaceae bacterium]
MSGSPKSLPDLLAVMAALRTPGTGCPWDLEQTFATIAPYTIEEAYEVADAIERADLAALKEELGDLLLQVVYHARMAEEARAFSFADVVDTITRKMIRRHPHVFGSAEERAAGASPGFWERIKAEEKAQGPAAHGIADAPSREGEREKASILADVPVGLPGLTRAVKLQAKAARVGFDWPSLAPVCEKLKEELVELEEAIDAAGAGESDRAEIAEEYGDLLFVMANIARHLKIDPEAALRSANQKFVRRFRRIEEVLAADGRVPAQSTLAEMDRLWDQAKAEERAAGAASGKAGGGQTP